MISSIPLKPGDEIVCLSITYGSTKKIMKDACVRTGATLRIINIPLPILSPESVILSVIKELNFNTKLIILDQITSNTAMILPIADISILCKQFGAIVLIDAAHSMFSQDCSIYTPDQEIFSSELSKRLPQEKTIKTNPKIIFEGIRAHCTSIK